MHKSVLTFLALLSSLPQASTFGVKSLFCFPVAEKRLNLETFDCPQSYSLLEHKTMSFSPSMLAGPELSFNLGAIFKLCLFSGFELKGQQYNLIYVAKPQVNSEPLKEAIEAISATSNHAKGTLPDAEMGAVLGRLVTDLRVNFDVNQQDELRTLIDVSNRNRIPSPGVGVGVVRISNEAMRNLLHLLDNDTPAEYYLKMLLLDVETLGTDDVRARIQQLEAAVPCLSSASVMGKEKALEELAALIESIRSYKPKEVINTISVTQHLPLLASLSCKIGSYNNVALTANFGSGVSMCKASWKVSQAFEQGWKKSDETKFAFSPMGMASLGLDIGFGPTALVASIGYVHLGSSKLKWPNGKSLEPSFSGVLVEIGLSASF